MKRVLTIAGSDSGGGAGIQADLKAITLLGGFGMSVVTALTAQNTMGVHGIHEIPSSFVEKQMEVVLSDIGADAIKTGMLAHSEIIRVVARKIWFEVCGRRSGDGGEKRRLPSAKRCPGGPHQRVDPSGMDCHTKPSRGLRPCRI